MKKKNGKQKNRRTQREFPTMVVETKDFAGEIVAGEGVQKKLKINAPLWYQHQLNKFALGDKVSIYISSRRPKRSLQQNRYYFGAYLPLIASETGENDIERLHKLFAGKFLTEGIYEVLGEKVRMVRSTTTLSKAEFSEYIMKIEGETGIASPPTHNYFNDPAPLLEPKKKAK